MGVMRNDFRFGASEQLEHDMSAHTVSVGVVCISVPNAVFASLVSTFYCSYCSNHFDNNSELQNDILGAENSNS